MNDTTMNDTTMNDTAPWFPSATGWRLLPDATRPHAAAFCRFHRVARAFADDPGRTAAEMEQGLAACETLVMGNEPSRDLPAAVSGPARSLRDSLLATHMAPDHALHLLQALRKDAAGFRCASWSELLVYCQYAAAPLGRYLLALHGEDAAAARRSVEALCAAAHILERVRHCKRDLSVFGRLYLPEAWFREAGIPVDRLSAATAADGARTVIDRVLERTGRLLAEARPLAGAVGARGLRAELSVTLCLTERLARRLRRRDPLAGPVGPGRLARGLCAGPALVRRALGL